MAPLTCELWQDWCSVTHGHCACCTDDEDSGALQKHWQLLCGSLAPHNPRASHVDPNAAIIPSGAISLPPFVWKDVSAMNKVKL